MEGGIDADAPLDYATIQIFPNQNRYEVFVCGDNEVEKLAVGLLEQLLPHLPGVNNLYGKGLNANFKLQVTGALKTASWFTKSTLNRFLQIVGSPVLLNTSKTVEGEMSQLEEARKFHLSLYAQGNEDHVDSGETDGCSPAEISPTLKAEVKIASSDTSKNELLRAMDLRLAALRKELAVALNQAVGATCLSKEINDLVKFSEYFGAKDLTNSLCKILELSQKGRTDVLLNDDKSLISCMPRIDNGSETDGDTQKSRPVYSVTPVKYGVSPAIAAQAERQSSTESEESSDSSDGNHLSAERSRALTRSAQPRRSASPMRRIQIGRTGSRRAAAITIKSFNYYPAREKTSYHRDVATNSSEEEGSEHSSKKTANNVRRMSVQDAINLFERKQKDQTADVHKRSSTSNSSICTNKSVLRRWSAGPRITECSSPCQQELVSEDSAPLPCNDLVDGENSKNSVKEKLGSDFTSGSQNHVETSKVESELERGGYGAHDPVDIKTDTIATQGQESNGRSTASSEWSRQKEVELNQMLMKMMESQPVRTRKPQAGRSQNIPSEHRGGFYDHYKAKRDKKLQGEIAEKKAAKEAQFRAMQQILNERKAQMASTKVKDVGKKNPSRKPQKSVKNPSQPGNPRNESPKASATKKVSSKTPTLPATRKSWPSTPPTRAALSSPSKTPVGISSASTTPSRRKPQLTPSLPQLNAKVERSQPRYRNVKETQTDANRSLKVTKEKNQQTVTKSGKATKTNVSAVSGDGSGMVPSKPSFYNKVTRKSSVVPVPLESKPFLRKGFRSGPGVGPTANKPKHSPQLEESSANSGNMVETKDNEVVANSLAQVSDQQDQDIVSPARLDAAMELETLVNGHQNCDETENFNELITEGDDSFKEMAEPSENVEPREESVISPIAWVEIEEQQDLPNSYDDSTSQLTSPTRVAPVGLSTTGVRHSLSQMLQEDISEPDTVEWGNAENPPAMVCQKDAPKGLKRLLKFARKSKGDVNITGWSSPSVFSEGEDDSEESKGVNKRNTDNLLRKATLHSKEYGQKMTSFFEGYEKNMDTCELLSAQSNISKHNVQSSQKLHKSHVSTAASATKASRSFFSLSAFRGSKPNETQFH